MADVFISYSSEDRDRVRPLAEALQKRGLSVWWDRALAAGDDYTNVIAKALQQSKAVIVVWSRVSVDSPWVRDEAAHAREASRLVPVMFDKVQIPLGFGSINAEDFTAWNQRADAPQVALLEEVLRARIAGRDPDGAAIQKRRQRVGMRIRIVSILGALAVAAAGVGGVLQIMNSNKPAPVVTNHPTDSLSQLLELVNEGKITGDQAVQLSKLLQQQAFADVPTPTPASAPVTADSNAPALAPGADDAAKTMTADGATSSAVEADTAQLATVSDAELTDSAKSSFADAAAQLLQDPDPQVRLAAVQASNPATRKQGLDKLWAIANQNGPSSAAILRFCASIGVVTNDPRAGDALERARDLNPTDRRLWRMLSVSYRRENKLDAAQGAALVGEGLDKAADRKDDESTKSLEKALPLLPSAKGRAFVLGRLGDAAAKRDDWGTAEDKYKQAVDLHVRQKNVAGIEVDAPKLARAEAQQGDRKRACETLKQAQAQGADTVKAQTEQTCTDVSATSAAPVKPMLKGPYLQKKIYIAPKPATP